MFGDFNVTIRFTDFCRLDFIAGLQLCDTYDTSLEKFVELWVAFCVEKLEGINPTLDSLLQMEEDMKKEHCDPCEKLVEPSMEDRPLLEYV